MTSLFRTVLLIIFASSLTLGVAAQNITGTVHNQTTGNPSVGDEVTLFRLGQGMEEESHAKTDAQGAFTLNITSAQDQHLLQVSHDGVNYDQPVGGHGPIDLTVYDAVAKVPGLSSRIGFAQLASDGKVLKVSEWYEIDNTSNPPVTQSSPENFVLTLPPDAVIEAAQARRERSMWLKVSADPVKSQRGKYRINFPIRPGATQLNFVYHIPYQGSATLHLHVPYPIKRFGVIHPTSMTFKASAPNSFESRQISDELVGEGTVLNPVVGEVPAFEISGTGVAPEHGTQTAAPTQPPTVAAPPSSAHTTPNPASAVVNQSNKELWLMIAGIILILGIGIFTLWRMRARPVGVVATSNLDAKAPLLDALKEQLFQLESDRLHGAISPEQYAVSKQALSESIQRAMARKSST